MISYGTLCDWKQIIAQKLETLIQQKTCERFSILINMKHEE